MRRSTPRYPQYINNPGWRQYHWRARMGEVVCLYGKGKSVFIQYSVFQNFLFILLFYTLLDIKYEYWKLQKTIWYLIKTDTYPSPTGTLPPLGQILRAINIMTTVHVGMPQRGKTTILGENEMLNSSITYPEMPVLILDFWSVSF